jgi:hypothetical protein
MAWLISFFVQGCSLFLLLFIFPLPNVQGQVHELVNDKNHIRGVMESHLANLDGWETGDVLVRYESKGFGLRVDPEGTVKGPDSFSVAIKRKGLIRLRFDFERERALIINRKEEERRIFNSVDEEISEPSYWSDDRMVSFDAPRNICIGRLRPGKVHRLKNQVSIESLLHEFGVPNLKAFGTVYSNDAWRNEILTNTLRNHMQPELMKSISHVGHNRYQVFVLGKPRTGQESGGFRVYTDWDVSNNVPVKVVNYYGAEQDSAARSSRPWATETVMWQEINSNALPVKSSRSHFSPYKLAGELQFDVEFEQTTNLHWFSFNEELADDDFDPILLEDSKQIDELLSESVFEDECFE